MRNTNPSDPHGASVFSGDSESKQYTVLEVIGKGSYGVVCGAIDNHTGEKVAIKKIKNVFDNVADATRILREIKLLRLLKHGDVVDVKHIVLPSDPQNFKDIYVVFERMESDLHIVIESNDDLTHDHHKVFLYQLLRGLDYIHASGVLHRDLKPRNILANSTCKLKICDFGLARPVLPDDPRSPVMWTDYVATRWYRAPELCGCFYGRYSQAVDIWSIGCIFAEVLLGRALFRGSDAVSQLKLITDLLGKPSPTVINRISNIKARTFLAALPPKQPRNLAEKFPSAHPAALALLARLLSFDPLDRPTAAQALADPYFASETSFDGAGAGQGQGQDQDHGQDQDQDQGQDQDQDQGQDQDQDQGQDQDQDQDQGQDQDQDQGEDQDQDRGQDQGQCQALPEATEQEPAADVAAHFDFEHSSLNEHEVRALIYQEVLHYHPRAQAAHKPGVPSAGFTGFTGVTTELQLRQQFMAAEQQSEAQYQQQRSQAHLELQQQQQHQQQQQQQAQQRAMQQQAQQLAMQQQLAVQQQQQQQQQLLAAQELAQHYAQQQFLAAQHAAQAAVQQAYEASTHMQQVQLASRQAQQGLLPQHLQDANSATDSLLQVIPLLQQLPPEQLAALLQIQAAQLFQQQHQLQAQAQAHAQHAAAAAAAQAEARAMEAAAMYNAAYAQASLEAPVATELKGKEKMGALDQGGKGGMGSIPAGMTSALHCYQQLASDYTGHPVPGPTIALASAQVHAHAYVTAPKEMQGAGQLDGVCDDTLTCWGLGCRQDMSAQ
ncbi:hypothetical protein QJQ45_022410 [Haematococcus lacustris]|nr:hypothetical protein QJQ45_022410 [Haematococcus lacustris]